MASFGRAEQRESRTRRLSSWLRTQGLRMLTLSCIAPLLLLADQSFAAISPLLLPTIATFFGMTIMAAWLYSWRAPLYIMPGIALFEALTQHTAAPLISASGTYAFCATLAAPLSFSAMNWAGIPTAFGKAPARHIWRLIVLAGVNASVFSMMMKSVLGAQLSIYPLPFGQYYLLFFLEIGGLLLFMVGLTILLRQTRRMR